MKLTLPKVSGVTAFVSALFGASDVYAQDVVKIQHAVNPALPDAMAYLMPILVAAFAGGGTAIVAWLIKTFVGLSVEAFATFGETWADARLKQALGDKDPTNDVPAMAFTKAVKNMCAKLREAERKFPQGKSE